MYGDLTFIGNVLYSIYILIGTIFTVLVVKILQDNNKETVYIKLPMAIVSFLIAMGIVFFFRHFHYLYLSIFIYIISYSISLFASEMLSKFLKSLSCISISFFILIYTSKTNEVLSDKMILSVIYLSILLLFMYKIKEKTFSNFLYLLSFGLFVVTSIYLQNMVLITSSVLFFISESLLLAKYETNEEERKTQFKPEYFSATLTSFSFLLLPIFIVFM